VTELITADVRDMTGSAALPRTNGELVFEAPWQGRVFGLAVDLTQRLGLEWDVFRQQLIASIESQPDRPYFDSWLCALEAVAIAHGDVDHVDLARRAGVPKRNDEPGMGIVETFALPTDESTLLALLTEMFVDWWRDIRFGLLIQGAVFEIRLAAPVEFLGMFDGYVTIDVGDWHFHLCIGEHRGLPHADVSADVARHRRCARAELYRILHHDAPVSWGFRMYNGADEQQLTVMLPNPFLDDEQHELEEPEWSRLACWDHLRQRFLGLEPDVRDRTAARFHHA